MNVSVPPQNPPAKSTNIFWWMFILPLILVICVVTGGLVFLYIQDLYPGMGEEHVHRIEAEDYLPRDNIEIRAKEYFNIDFTAACFLPGYFYLTKKTDSAYFLKKTLNYKGPLPTRFSLEEDRWGLILTKGSNIYKIIYMVDMGHPDFNILRNLQLKQTISSDKEALICLSINADQDLIVKLKRSEKSYVPISIQLQNK